MKVLLLGEYSRLHNSLKEGLEQLGVEARIAATGDGFKQYPADFDLRPRVSLHPAMRPVRQGIFRITGYDPARAETAWRLRRQYTRWEAYDVVQLINSFPFESHLGYEQKIIRRILERNDKAFLLACGDDPVVNRYYLENPDVPYSVLTPMQENPSLKDRFRYSLKYLEPAFTDWHEELMGKVRGIIPTDLDYAIPYRNHPKALSMIPNPVNTDIIRYAFPHLKGPVRILHGINSGNYWKKGNGFFEKALEKIMRRYGSDKVQIVQVRDLAYKDYIRRLEDAHIVLDQVYSWDQGYNALESMAMGKVVFTGAEKVFYEHYGLDEPVCINALPDVDDLVEKLSELIENPALLQRISENARRFIEREHHYVRMAERYVEVWEGF